MADNITAKANVGAGTDVLAADDIGGVLFPRVKMAIGADGVNNGDVSAANPLPITGALTDAQLRAAAVPVSGPLTDAQLRATVIPVSLASSPLPTGAATQTTVASIDTKTPALVGGAVPVTGPITDAQLRAAAVPVSAAALPLPTGAATAAGVAAVVTALGTPAQAGAAVSISNFPGTQAVSALALPLPAGAATATGVAAIVTALGLPLQTGGAVSVSNLPATQAVTGPVTDAQLRLTPVPVTGSVTGPVTDAQIRATPVPVSGTVTATGPLTDTQLRLTAVPVSGPLTDAQLRATAVPVSGTVTATGPLTDTQLRLTAVPVSGPATDTQLRATPLPISGTVALSGFSGLTDTQLRATSVPVLGPVTDAQLRASAVSVSGPLTDTQLRATAVPVSGPLTDTQMRATAVLVSGPQTDAQARASAQPMSLPDLTTSTYNVAGVITINTVLLTVDCLAVRGLAIQCIAMGTTGVVTPQWSNDNTNWVAAQIMTPLGVAAATFNAVGLWTTPIFARYFRLILTTATTAGTTTLDVKGSSLPLGQPVVQPVSGTVAVSGTVTTSGTVTANVAGAGITGGVISPLTVAGVSIEASSAKTASGNSAAALTNGSGNGAYLFINVSAVTGTSPTLTVKVQAQDPVSAGWTDLPGAVTASIIATGLYLLALHPAMPDVANSKVSVPLPRTYRLVWTIGGTTPSFTFSVGAQYII